MHTYCNKYFANSLQAHFLGKGLNANRTEDEFLNFKSDVVRKNKVLLELSIYR